MVFTRARLRRLICCTQHPGWCIPKSTQRITLLAWINQSCSSPKAHRPTSHGSPKILRPAEYWVIRPRQLLKRASDGRTMPPRTSLSCWLRCTTLSRGTALEDDPDRLREWNSPGTRSRLPAQRRNHAHFRSLLSRGSRAMAHAADAPAVWARYCFDGSLRTPRVVCAPRISCGHPGCTRTRRLVRRFLSLSSRRPRRRGNDCMAEDAPGIKWSHRHVWLFVPGRDAAARSRRETGRPAVRCSTHDCIGPLSRLVLSSRGAAVELDSGLGHSDVARGRPTEGPARCKRSIGVGVD